ncbi:MAG: FAD-binding protein [Myxococcota bacterium]|nr:FAD-binding protein [Myxococcota bacterium]MDW8363706.1 FAD-linked oxidase C-terminal domain-containing protein [Myxococcales bacterium]
MSLEQALVQIDRALGDGRVLTDPDVLDGYARDESEAPAVRPGAVVRATSTAEVAAVLRAAHEHRVPVTPRTGGTGRVGGAVPEPGGIVLACERMDAIKEIARADLYCVVEPGVVTARLHATVEAEGLFYAPDPNSGSSCGIGGNVACNAGGPRAFKYGPTREHVLGLEVVTGDGSVLRLGRRTRKGTTGYDLASLVVGSEGTLAVVTEATLRLLPRPESVLTLLVPLPDLDAVQGSVTGAIETGLLPRCIELLDAVTLDLARASGAPLPADAGALLIVELDGEASEVERGAERIADIFTSAGARELLVARHAGDRERLWERRREMSRALRAAARFKLAEDVIVPRTRIGALLGAVRRIAERTGLCMPTYGHAGDGNLHVNVLWDDEAQRPLVERAIGELFAETVRLGGTLSGEHGIGLLKAPYLPLAHPPALVELQRRVKSLFDPRGILNPGKIFPAPTSAHGPC